MCITVIIAYIRSFDRCFAWDKIVSFRYLMCTFENNFLSLVHYNIYVHAFSGVQRNSKGGGTRGANIDKIDEVFLLNP